MLLSKVFRVDLFIGLASVGTNPTWLDHGPAQHTTYKIHLGSANILMEPNDQYLCIVPASTRDEPHATLPFEGDALLSLILSKAFLLADDARITDPTILNQIGARG